MAGSPKSSVTQFWIEFHTANDINEALTTHYSHIRIINSTRSIWPIFEVYFHIDNQVFIEKNLYGADDITCKIWYTAETGEPVNEPVTYTLLYLESRIELTLKEEKNNTIDNLQEVQRRYVKVTFLSKPAYLAMTTFVNKLWEDPDGLTGTQMRPLDFIQEILDDGDIPYKIYPAGMNEDLVQQMVIPPTTLKGAVDYINQNYGIYTGPMFRYVNYSGEFLMWDLKQMYENKKENPWIKIHKLPSHFSTPDLFEEITEKVIQTSDEFTTYDASESIHHANANVIKYGYDNIYIYHPHEDIAVFMKKNVDDIVKDFGIYHASDEMKYNKELMNRKLYYHDMVGFESGTGYDGKYNDAMLTHDMATSFQNAAAVRIQLYRNVKFQMVQKVGEVLFLEPYMDHEKFKGSNYKGGYLISDSDILFSKMRGNAGTININCVATLTAYRTTQSMD
jgi:hypothetical protein